MSILDDNQNLALDKGYEELGKLISWKVSSEICLAREVLSDLAKLAGLNQELLPEPRNKLAAFKKVRTDVQNKLGKDGVLVRPLLNDEKAMIFSILVEEKDLATEHVSTRQAGLLKFYKDAENMGCTEDSVSDRNLMTSVFDEALISFDFHQKITADLIRKMLTTFVKNSGVPFREDGGVYFLSKAFSPDIEAFRTLLPLVNTESSIISVPIIDAGDMPAIAEKALEKELQELEEYSSSLTAEEKLDTTRLSTLEAQVRNFKILDAKVKEIANTLGFQQESLLNRITAVKTKIMAVIKDKPPVTKKTKEVVPTPVVAPVIAEDEDDDF
jgi:hypothetical protein